MSFFFLPCWGLNLGPKAQKQTLCHCPQPLVFQLFLKGARNDILLFFLKNKNQTVPFSGWNSSVPVMEIHQSSLPTPVSVTSSFVHSGSPVDLTVLVELSPFLTSVSIRNSDHRTSQSIVLCTPWTVCTSPPTSEWHFCDYLKPACFAHPDLSALPVSPALTSWKGEVVVYLLLPCVNLSSVKCRILWIFYALSS